MDTHQIIHLILFLIIAYLKNYNDLMVLHALRQAEEDEEEQERDLYVYPRPDECWMTDTVFNFDLPQAEAKFREKLRMSRSTFFAVLNKCQHKLFRRTSNWKLPVPPHFVLAIGLYRLAQGCSYGATADAFNVGKTTAIEACHDVIAALTELKDEVIRFPETLEEKTNVIAGFDRLSKLKNIIGAIDGTHLEI